MGRPKENRYTAVTICPECKANEFFRCDGKRMIEIRIKQEHKKVCPHCKHQFTYSYKNTVLRDKGKYVWGGKSHGDKQLSFWR